jgi:hypothetical protein
MRLRAGPQALGSAFGSDVPLRHSQHLKADHEFSDRRRAQQGRIEVGVEVPLRMGSAIGWCLVEAHGVGEAGLKEQIKTGGKPLQRIGST